ncbi:hypothetical protein [Apilactobacillus apinorum]|uniref:hypothetical protein n=1 Tax=Apilactobacillus apinorum TaxID=1218495 RepID=UPI0006B57E7C|nr:hypothetical protein [Apilactobacillus apinorum]KOY69011.1 hypothetical protein RZ74_08110 [Apilactobacillus apinorum]CAI2679813.1 Hypothetical protein AAPFHON13_08610 [Apilactobacillus apinorum]
MDLSKTVDNRINQLIQNDKNTNDTLDMLNNSTIGMIEQYLTQFFNRYAVDNELTVSQANAMINSWDKQQFQQLLNDLNVNDLSYDAQQRVKVLGVKAGMNHGAMLNAIIAMTLVYLTDKQKDIITTHETQTVTSQIQHLAKVSSKFRDISKLIFAKIDNSADAGINNIRNSLGLNGLHYNTGINVKTGKTLVTEDKNTKLWSNNLWNKSDEMTNDVENLVNQHIRHNMSLDDLKDMLIKHTNKNQFNPKKSIADRIKQTEYNAQRLIRTESSRLVNIVNKITYRTSNITTVDLHHEPSACDYCVDLSNQGPWSIDDAPEIPQDTHPNCYCYLIPHDGDSNLAFDPN